jgi:hypothetical protein
MTRFKIRALVGTLIAAALVAAPEALATGPTVSVRPLRVAKPGYFVLKARPGSMLHGTVLVVNTGQAGMVDLYPVDATTGQTSGAVYRARRDVRSDVGAWIRLSRRRLYLGRGEARAIRFSVHVPTAASDGQHLGGIVAEPTAPTVRHRAKRGGHAFHINVFERAVVAVQVNLPGPRVERMALTGIRAEARPPYQQLIVALLNQGNVLLKGRGTLAIRRGDGGRTIQKRPFRLDTVVPGSGIDYPLIEAGKPLPKGSYEATIRLVYGHGRQLTRTLPLRVGSKQLDHVTVPRPADQAHPRVPPLLLGVGALGVFLLGSAAATMQARLRSRGSLRVGH